MSKLPSVITKANLIPATEFHQLPYWKRLSDSEQKQVFAESQELARSIFLEGASKLQQGQHLAALQDLLLPHRLYVQHIRKLHRKISIKTSYRYIEGWKVAKQFLPKTFLEVVLSTGVDLGLITGEQHIGKFTPIVKQLGGIPRTDDKLAMREFVNRMEKKYSTWKGEARWITGAQSSPPADMLKGVYRHVRSQIKRLPEDQRRSALKNLFGYLLKEFDITGLAVTATAPPEEFTRGMGRPKEN